MREVEQLIRNKAPVVVLYTAPGCQYCDAVKAELPALKSKAESLGVTLETVNVLENQSFIAQYPFSGDLPWAGAFTRGQLQGGVVVNKDILSQMLEVVAQDEQSS